MQASSITLNNFQIHSNSSDIGFVVWQDSDGFEFPSIRISPYPKPGEHGAIVPNQFYDGRSITLNGRISGATPAQYLLNKRSFLNLLRIVESTLNIATPLLLQWTTIDGLNLQVYCYASQPPKIKDMSLNHGTWQIQLFAPDYNIYDQLTQTKTINVPSGGGLLFPAIFPVTFAAQTGGSAVILNGGNSDTFPVITFTGPLTSPYVKNLTLGTQFQVNYTLASTDTLVCDMANKTMVLNGSQNAMQYFNYLNTWLSLQPGNNTIIFGSGNSSDTGQVSIAFNNAYIGI